MEITKFSSQLFFALEQATLHIWRFLKQFTERATNAARKIRDLVAGSVDAVLVASAKVAKSSSQLVVPIKQARLHLRRVLNPLTERGMGAFQKIPEILASFLDAVAVTNAKIAKSSSQLLVALKQAPARLRETLEPLTARGKNVLDKSRHLQD